MIRAYKYKLKPTMKQQKMLSQAFGNARFIYNWGLERKKTEWEQNKKNVSYFDLAKELTLLKKDGNHDWLNNSANVSLQQSLRNLDNAYTKFFKAKKGFPKFKTKKNKRDTIKFIASVHFDFETFRVSIPKIGKVKFCKNKKFDEDAKLGTLTVTRDTCGEYWCTIVVEDNKPNIPKTKVCEETSIGIDLGIKDYAIISDGTKYGNPKFLEKGQKHLADLQKKLSATQTGSKRHEKARLKVAQCHKKIANRRSDFIHKLSTMIIKHDGWDTICLEDLNIAGMLQNHNLAQSINSVAWNEFVRQLKYKSEWYGKNVILIGRFEPSSKTCSSCGYIKSDLTLSDREWICPQCGTKHDRDVNAAINIKKFGIHPQALIGFESKLEEK